MYRKVTRKEMRRLRHETGLLLPRWRRVRSPLARRSDVEVLRALLYVPPWVLPGPVRFPEEIFAQAAHPMRRAIAMSFRRVSRHPQPPCTTCRKTLPALIQARPRISPAVP